MTISPATELAWAPLAQVDPELWQALRGEHARQRHKIELIASENYTFAAVMEAQGSWLTNKYAEGYPGRRYYGGCEYVDIAELGVLAQIDRGVDLPSQVARALRLDPARVTHLTDRLVARGYIERTIDPQDRRCWRLHLTALGAQRLAEGRGDVSVAMETLLDGLSEEERAGLIRGLEGVRRVLGTLPPIAPAGRVMMAT